MYLAKQILINTVTGWLTRAFSICIALILTPVLLSSLGKYDYGLWVSIGQGAGLLMLLDFGIANSVCRFIVREDVLIDPKAKNGIFSTAMFFFVVAAFLVVFITFLITPLLPGLLNVDESHKKIVQLVFFVFGLNTALILPLRVGRGLLQAKHRYDYIDLISTIANIIQFGLVLFCWWQNALGLIYLCWITVSCVALAEFFLFVKSLRLFPGIRFSFLLITKKRLRDLFSLGSSSLVQTFSGMLQGRGLTLAITIMLGAGITPLFFIPFSLLQRLGPFIGRAGATFMPIASGLDSVGDVNRIMRLSTYGMRYALMLGMSIGIFLILFGRELLQLWLGNGALLQSDIETMYLVLIIMIFPLVFSRANKGNQSILRATGAHWIASNLLLVFSIIGLLVGIMLMKFTSLGIWGAVIGWSIRTIIADGILFTVVILKRFGTEKSIYFKSAYLRPLLVSVPVLFFNYILISFVSLNSISNIVFCSFIYIVTSIACILFFCVEADHRKALFAFVKRTSST